jgi:fumarate hydratase class II
MHIAAYAMAMNKTIPAIRRLREATKPKSDQWADVVKIGRTHLEDATPLTVGQEWSGYAGALEDARAELERATQRLLSVARARSSTSAG